LAGAIKNEGTSDAGKLHRYPTITPPAGPTRGQSIGGYGTPVILRNTVVAGSFAGRPDMEGFFESQDTTSSAASMMEQTTLLRSRRILGLRTKSGPVGLSEFWPVAE
jgi:hypothetical protein